MEKYRLNDTPLRTSNNYGINDISLEIEKPVIKEFDNFSIQTYEPEENVKMTFGGIDNKIDSKIGLEINCNNQIEITIPENVECKTPIVLDYEFDEDNNNLADNIIINMEKNSKAIFYIKFYSDNKNEKFFHYLKQTTKLEKNANANINIINLLNRESTSFLAVENEVNENAFLEHTIIDLGGKNKISNYYSKLIGDKSINNLKSIYVGTNNDIIDINYNIDTLGKYTKCNIETKGALNDNAHKNFKGTIDFKEGAIKAVGKENENCILLSENARAKSLPMLLCHEEDVEGEHSVATGKPKQEEIFYLMSRGIDFNNARKILVEASFKSIIDSIEDENIKETINIEINSLLNI